MAGKPKDDAAELDLIESIRELIHNGHNQASIVKQLRGNDGSWPSESTIKRHYKRIQPHVRVSDDVAEQWEHQKTQQKSRILADIERLDSVIQLCIENSEFKAIGSLQGQKTQLYKLHAASHPGILWFDESAS